MGLSVHVLTTIIRSHRSDCSCRTDRVRGGYSNLPTTNRSIQYPRSVHLLLMNSALLLSHIEARYFGHERAAAGPYSLRRMHGLEYD